MSLNTQLPKPQLETTEVVVDDIYFLGYSMRGLPLTSAVGAYTIGIFITYITIFIIQESVFKTSNFESGGLLVFFQFLSYALFGLIHRFFVPQHKRRAPLKFFFIIGFYAVAGTAASHYSLTLLNFPTWVLFKSSRVIGVMIGGIFILGKKYHLKEYLGVCLLAVGLVIFTLGDIRLLPAVDPLGIALVLFSLVMNSLEGNMQEKGVAHYKSEENEMVIYGYTFGAIQILPYLLWTGELKEGMEFLIESPYVGAQIIANCVLGYFGILFVLGLVRISSALTTVIVTSCRKALTVVFSFVLFAKPFSMLYVAGFATFFTGVALNVYTKNSKPIDAYVQNFFSQFLPRQQKHVSSPLSSSSSPPFLSSSSSFDLDGASKNV